MQQLGSWARHLHQNVKIRLILIKWSAEEKCATSWENLFMPYANNKGADQPGHPHSLISAFVVRCLDSIIPLLAIAEISRLYVASVAVQTGLSLNWSKPPKTGFLVTRLKCGINVVGFWPWCIIIESTSRTDESLPYWLLPFCLWFVPFRLLLFRLLWKFWLFPFCLPIIADKEIFVFVFVDVVYDYYSHSEIQCHYTRHKPK